MGTFPSGNIAHTDECGKFVGTIPLFPFSKLEDYSIEYVGR